MKDVLSLRCHLGADVQQADAYMGLGLEERLGLEVRFRGHQNRDTS